ncbi:MAG TPA: hypothetical protein PLN52_14155, partial [Opitutaceae bacterium]|nr:hypothetical protein [Opitutaceae bacterium]
SALSLVAEWDYAGRALFTSTAKRFAPALCQSRRSKGKKSSLSKDWPPPPAATYTLYKPHGLMTMSLSVDTARRGKS